MPRYMQECSSASCAWRWEITAAPYENPSCPRCGAETTRSWHGTATAIERDEIPGGQLFENGWAEPRKFYSHSEHRKALAAAGYEIRAKWAGPNDQHLKRWDTVDLDAAAALVNRGAEARRAYNERKKADLPITVTEVGTLTAKDLHAD